MLDFEHSTDCLSASAERFFITDACARYVLERAGEGDSAEQIIAGWKYEAAWNFLQRFPWYGFEAYDLRLDDTGPAVSITSFQLPSAVQQTHAAIQHELLAWDSLGRGGGTSDKRRDRGGILVHLWENEPRFQPFDYNITEAMLDSVLACCVLSSNGAVLIKRGEFMDSESLHTKKRSSREVKSDSCRQALRKELKPGV
jgi:hypothetical protein